MSADLLVENARVITLDDHKPAAQAIAVTDGRIVAIGDNDEIAGLAGPATRRIDAAGGSLLPGFNEAHMHLFTGAAEMAHLRLHGVHGIGPLSQAIRAFASERPDAAILIAQGADYAMLERPVTRADLDGILADRPFAMAAPDHHTMWANTAALDACGLLRGAALPAGHEVVIGPDGLATGELRETAAFSPLLELAGEGRVNLGLYTGHEPAREPSPAERAADRALMRRGLAWCARHGITSLQNMDGNLYQLQLLSEIEAEGDLSCRARIPFHFKADMPLSELDRADHMARTYRSEWLSSGTVKVFIDGVVESWTAVMLDRYADRPDGWRGEPIIDAALFRQLAIEADGRGLQIAVHAIGDGAVRLVLDGYEAAIAANGRRDSRHRIEHIEVTTEADIARFAPLGVIASMQPTHVPGSGGFGLEPYLGRIGRPRWHHAFPWKSIGRAGGRIAFGSDWPVAPIDPLGGIQEAMVRKPWADDIPDQRLDLLTALEAYTIGGAHAEFMEHRKGALRPGYLADMVILDGDIEATAPEEVHLLKVATTVCGGRVTYQA